MIDLDRFNAILKAIDAAADDDSSLSFDQVLQRELEFIRIAELSVTHWSYAADLLGQDKEWRDLKYTTHSISS